MKKILIIDDDKVFAKILGSVLIEEHFAVTGASNGHDGLLAFEKEKPDLVVLDMKMPALDGVGFLKQLREKNDNKTPVPVVIVSNLATIEKVSEGIGLGIKGYISKSEETTESIVADIKRILTEEDDAVKKRTSGQANNLESHQKSGL